MAPDGASCFLVFFFGAILTPFISVLLPSMVGETMLGIDLGTTYSVAVVCHRGEVTTVEIDGAPTVPSVVHFAADSEPLVGSRAAAQRAHFPEHTIFDSKRIIARNLAEDEVAAAEVSALPYSVVDLGGGEVGLQVPGGPLTPIAVGAHILRYLKKAAEVATPLRKWSGFQFKTATVSVPVNFTAAQRAATVKAGEAAGFRMVRILEEPIAAAIAFGLHKGTRERLALIFDMGGGTLDVALLRLELKTRTFLVIEASGDPHLGGEDFDRALAGNLLPKLTDALPPLSTHLNLSLFASLLQSVEAAKRRLSSQETARVDLVLDSDVADALGASASSLVPELEISRDLLEDVCEDLLDRALLPVYEVLTKGDVHPDEVDDVVLVGGSSRLTAIQQRLEIFFKGKVLNHDTNPETAIAIGAALSFGC